MAAISTVPTTAELWLTMLAIKDQRTAYRDDVWADLGLPFSRLRALRRLERGPHTQRELADMMGVDAAAMSGIVSDLQRRELATRTVDPGDGRRKIVTITQAGRDAMTRARTSPNLAPAGFSALTETQRIHLAEILETIRSAGEASR